MTRDIGKKKIAHKERHYAVRAGANRVVPLLVGYLICYGKC